MLIIFSLVPLIIQTNRNLRRPSSQQLSTAMTPHRIYININIQTLYVDSQNTTTLLMQWKTPHVILAYVLSKSKQINPRCVVTSVGFCAVTLLTITAVAWPQGPLYRVLGAHSTATTKNVSATFHKTCKHATSVHLNYW